MKVKAFSSSRADSLQENINTFLEQDILVVDVKFSSSQSYDEIHEETDFTYSALIIYEEGICNE